MLRFEDPQYLWLLLLIPLFAVMRITYLINRKRKLCKFGEWELLRLLSPDVSKYRPAVKFWLAQSGLALIALMLARPQSGATVINDNRKGIEMIVALDISNSMLAEDMEPSRLTRSKMLVENIIEHFKDDRIGLVVFAGDAFVQLPITSDYLSAKMFLQDINPSLIEAQGTDIGEAIKLSLHSFTKDKNTGKAIILITDGEDHEGDAEKMAKEAYDKGVKVILLGVGSTEGTPIPVGNGGYLKDNNGQVVMTALNENMCRNVAEAGNGVYIHVDNTNLVENKLENELTKLQKGEINGVVYKDFDEQFQAVGIFALLFLMIESVIQEAKGGFADRVILFKRKK